jgi:hypothetical protein
MIDTIKEKLIEYKYQLAGFIIVILLSGVYKFYYPNIDTLISNDNKIVDKPNKNDDKFMKELNLLKKKLSKTQEELLNYKDKLNDKKELSLYQNSQYNFNRLNKKILILKWTPNGTDFQTINLKLKEPFKIDKLSDIYLDTFTTAYKGTYPTFSNDPNISSYVLKIDQFKIDSYSNDSSIHNSIMIPNEYVTTPTAATSRKTHKKNKLNFICSINPTTITEITGKITGINGTTDMFKDNNDVFTVEFLFIARDK